MVLREVGMPIIERVRRQWRAGKTHSRHIEFGGKIISPDALYWGKYRDLVSAPGFVGDCAKIVAPAVAETTNVMAIARFLWDIWLLPPTSSLQRSRRRPTRPAVRPVPALMRQCWSVNSACHGRLQRAVLHTPGLGRPQRSTGLRRDQWDGALAMASGCSLAETDSLITPCFSR